VAEEWEIWDEEEEAARSEVEAKKLVPEKFYKWIKVFGKKAIREDADEEGMGPCNRLEERGRYTHCQERKGRR